MQINKIYIDLDGVLADFDSAMKTACGGERLDNDAMWAVLREIPHFYRHLALLPDAVELFSCLFERYGNRVEILTGLPKPFGELATAATDKRDWVNEFLSPAVKVNTVSSQREKLLFCTGENDLLIDDFKSNIKRWTREGGTGIRCRNCRDVIAQLKEMGVI